MSHFDFDALIAPVTPEQFFSEYWETKPLRILRNQSAHYAPLMLGADIDYILSTACLLNRAGVELLGSAASVDAAAKPVAAVYQAYRQGASIRINDVQRYWKPIWTFCISMEQLFGFQVAANLYCTPANSRGLDRHYDRHDAIILQISGRKNWRIFGAPVELPLEHVPLMRFEKSGAAQYRDAPVIHDEVAKYAAPEPLDEFVLEQGDLLYLPRGFVHEAWSAEAVSAHVTIGIYPVTWVDLISVAMGQLANKDTRFRKALPVGFARRSADTSIKEEFVNLLQELTRQADVLKAVEEINRSLIWNRQAIGEGALTDARSEPIGTETFVERRPGLLCRLVIDGDTVRLSACHCDLSLPRFFEPAMRFVSETQNFSIGAIPGGLSEHSKLSLVRRLIDDGFLRVSKNSNQSERT